MSYRQIGGLPPPPLGLAPLSPIPASSSYRMDPGAGILPPPRRSRTPSTSTPSFSTSSFTAGPSSHFASSMFDNRYGAFSVPPQKNYPSLDPSSSSTTDSITPRMTACLPCKRGHLKCGRGMRPCASCIKRGKAEECLEGIPPDQAQVFIRLFREKQTRQLNNNPITGVLEPIFDDTPLFQSSSSARTFNGYGSLGAISQSNLSYPPLGQLDDVVAERPVIFIMSQDMRIGRASQESLRTFGYHPHEMCNQPLTYYLPITERDKFRSFSAKLFSPLNPPGNGLSETPAELARLPLAALTAAVRDMRSIVGHYHFRRHSKEMVSVRVELWFSSYHGATVNNFSTFRNALVVARISPINANIPPPPCASPKSYSTYPSVLLPAPASSNGDNFTAPRRSRTPSISNANKLPPLGPLPPFPSSPSSRMLPPPSSSLGNFGSSLPPFGSLGSLPPLGALPPLETFPSLSQSNTTPRKRRTSTANPASLLDPFDHGSGLGPSTSRPRLRSPTPQSGHRRSMSSEAGYSSTSTASYDPSTGLSSAPLNGFQPLQRPPSRNRRPLSHFDSTNFSTGAVPNIPRLMQDNSYSPSKLTFMNPHNAPLLPLNNNHYKPRKQSYIAIDGSYHTPPTERARTPSHSTGTYTQLSATFNDNYDTSANDWSSHLPLPLSFSSLSLDDSPRLADSPPFGHC